MSSTKSQAKLCYNGILLDSSGSMYPVKHQTFNSLKKFQADQLEDDIINKSSPFIIHTFSNDVKLEHKNKLSELIEFNYQPSGGTALYDGIFAAVNYAETHIEHMLEKPDLINIIIITDGHENSSTHTKNEVKKLFEKYEKEGWEFIFLGANQDAILSGGDLGILKNQCMTYNQSNEGITNVMRSVSQAVKRKAFSGSRNVEFTDLERMESNK